MPTEYTGMRSIDGKRILWDDYETCAECGKRWPCPEHSEQKKAKMKYADKVREAKDPQDLGRVIAEQHKESIDLLGWAWTIIANAGSGDWGQESEEWQNAATKWREDYHKFLKEV